MTVSDYLIALALTLHPQSDHKLAVTVSADALNQPNGGAVFVRTFGEPKKEGGTHLTTEAVKTTAGPQECANGKHLGGVKRTEHSVRGVKTITPQKCAAGEHPPK